MVSNFSTTCLTYWFASSIPCRTYCAQHVVVLFSSSFCNVTNYPNHSLNLGRIGWAALRIGWAAFSWDLSCSCSQVLTAGIGTVVIWSLDSGWISETAHLHSGQVMLHCWLGAQLGLSTWVAICDLIMWLGFLTARWPQIGLLTWHLRAPSASAPVSEMQAQLWNLCRITSTALYWLQASGYRFKGQDIGPISQWGWVVRPHCKRAWEMGDFAGIFRKYSPMLFQSRKFSPILGIFGNYLIQFSPPLFPFGTPNIQMFDYLYWCSNFLFNFFISLSFYPPILKFLYLPVLVILKLLPYCESLYCTPVTYTIVHQLYFNKKSLKNFKLLPYF